VQIGRGRAWAAAGVEHGTDAADLLGERVQRRSHPRRRTEIAHAHRDVVVGDGVVGRADGVKVGRRINGVGHGRRR